MALNGGIIDQASNAAEGYNQATNDEERLLLEVEIKMAKYSEENLDNLMTGKGYIKIADGVYESETTGKVVTVAENGRVDIYDEGTIGALVVKGEIPIGTYVSYVPNGTTYVVEGQYASSEEEPEDQLINRDTSLKWRVLDIKDGQVRLISDVRTSVSVRFYGANGYNNVVKILNDLCKELYSGSQGTAASLNIEDIQKHTTYDYREYVNANVDTGKYGGTRIYNTTSYRWYPNIFAQEKTGWVLPKQGTVLELSQQNDFITGDTQGGFQYFHNV